MLRRERRDSGEPFAGGEGGKGEEGYLIISSVELLNVLSPSQTVSSKNSWVEDQREKKMSYFLPRKK